MTKHRFLIRFAGSLIAEHVGSVFKLNSDSEAVLFVSTESVGIPRGCIRIREGLYDGVSNSNLGICI